MAEEKTQASDMINIKDIEVFFTLDSQKVSPTTHIFLKSWDSSDIVLESANLLIECIFKITQRRFHLVPESNWLRNESMHSKKSNDGSRCRIPITVGVSSQMFNRLGFKYNEQNTDHQHIVQKIKYESTVYIPGVDENPIKLTDHALIITANDQNIKQLTIEITNNMLKHFEDAKKTITNDTKQVSLPLETCLNL
eukprot:140209_1